MLAKLVISHDTTFVTSRVWSEVHALFGDQAVPVWSGGNAFSYFPAESAQGEFGMIILSSDQSTVTPNTDFNNLQTVYNQVPFINNPTQSSARLPLIPLPLRKTPISLLQPYCHLLPAIRLTSAWNLTLAVNLVLRLPKRPP